MGDAWRMPPPFYKVSNSGLWGSTVHSPRMLTTTHCCARVPLIKILTSPTSNPNLQPSPVPLSGRRTQTVSRESALTGLQSFSYVEDSTELNVMILILMGIFTRLAAFLALCYCNRDKMGLHTWQSYLLCRGASSNGEDHARSGRGNVGGVCWSWPWPWWSEDMAPSPPRRMSNFLQNLGDGGGTSERLVVEIRGTSTSADGEGVAFLPYGTATSTPQTSAIAGVSPRR